ncbi:MAG: NAD(P)-dependent oxidoreductase, partial [Bryobacteraceae bacterium]
MRRFAVLLTLCAATLAAQNKKIVVSNADPELLKLLQSATPKAQVVELKPESAAQQIAEADAFICDIKPDQVRAGKNLKWVQVMAAGVEKVLHLSGSSDLRDSGITLTNNQIVQGPEIADHAMAMLLMLTRGLNKFAANRLTETWQARPYGGIELRGRNAVVIGCGGIGTQISVRAWAFGMNVTCIDPEDIPFSPFIQKVVKPDQINEVIPQADVVFISVPHTEKSHKMMGPQQFDLMKKDSYFIA